MVILLCPSCHSWPTNLTTTVFLVTQFFILLPQLCIEAYFTFESYSNEMLTPPPPSNSNSTITWANDTSLVLQENVFHFEANELEISIHNETLFWNLHFIYTFVLATALVALPMLSIMGYIREKMFLRWTTHFSNSDKWQILRVLSSNFVPLMLLELFPLCMIFSEHLYYENITHGLAMQLLVALFLAKYLLFYTGCVHLILLMILGDSAMERFRSNEKLFGNDKNSDKNGNKGNNNNNNDNNDNNNNNKDEDDSTDYGCCSHFFIRIFAVLFAFILCLLPYIPWLVYITYQQVSELRVKEYAKKLLTDMRVETRKKRKKGKMKKKKKKKKNSSSNSKHENNIKNKNKNKKESLSKRLRKKDKKRKKYSAQINDGSSDESDHDLMYQKGDVVVLRVAKKSSLLADEPGSVNRNDDDNEYDSDSYVVNNSEFEKKLLQRIDTSRSNKFSDGCCECLQYCTLCFYGRPDSNPGDNSGICSCGWKTSYFLLWVYLWISYLAAMYVMVCYDSGWNENNGDVALNKEMGIVSQMICFMWLIVLLWVSSMFSYFSWRLALIFHCL